MPAVSKVISKQNILLCEVRSETFGEESVETMPDLPQPSESTNLHKREESSKAEPNNLTSSSFNSTSEAQIIINMLPFKPVLDTFQSQSTHRVQQQKSIQQSNIESIRSSTSVMCQAKKVIKRNTENSNSPYKTERRQF